jgi:sugar (pentulose or hexulose) kinase
MVRVTSTFEPQPDARAVYEPMYEEFKHFYDRLHASYARLNRQVGR